MLPAYCRFCRRHSSKTSPYGGGDACLFPARPRSAARIPQLRQGPSADGGRPALLLIAGMDSIFTENLTQKAIFTPSRASLIQR